MSNPWLSLTWRDASFIATGVLIGAAASAMVMTGLQSANKAHAAPPAVQRVAAPVRPSPACPLQPAAAKASGTDGRFQMPAELHKYGPGDVGAFMVIGKEAAAEGRLRDAEIAFLMACRVADRFKGAESVESTNARAQLSLHYETLAQLNGPSAATEREELRRRAQLLRPPGGALPAPAPAAPPAAPVAVPAPEQPKQAATQPEAPAPRKAEVAAQAAAPVRSIAIAAPNPPRARRPVAVIRQERTGPGCAHARSATEKMICSDSQLARLDRELDWLNARASNTSRNSWVLKQSEQEWKRREASCRDRDCLMRTYTQRRQQLLNDIYSG
jgi:hypothetical protein